MEMIVHFVLEEDIVQIIFKKGVRAMLLKDASPEIYAQIDPTKNTDIEIEKLKAQSNIDLFWRCDKGHSWHAKVCSRMRGSKCPYCQHRAVLPGFNDLASTYPEIAG